MDKVLEIQMALLNKINFAFELLLGLNREGCPCSLVGCLEMDTKGESYRMLIVNYLVALIGNRKNDKVSIWHNSVGEKKEQIEKFHIDNADGIKNLYNTRDKIYAHFDTDYDSVLKNIEYDFIKACIDFLNEVLEYQGDK